MSSQTPSATAADASASTQQQPQQLPPLHAASLSPPPAECVSPSASASSSASAAPSSQSTSTNAGSSVSAESSTLTSTTLAASSTSQDTRLSPPDQTSHASAPSSTSIAHASRTMDIDQRASAAAMEIDSGTAAPASAAAPSAAAVDAAILSIEKDHAKVADAILKNLAKMLSALKKNPNLLANRKFRCDNIAVKKFVVDVKGALDICKFVGYQTLELTDKKTPYLVIEEAALDAAGKARLDAAIDAVAAKVADIERIAAGGASASAAKPAAAASGKVEMCLGGCGFCGSAETEGYCSVCFKKKFLAGGPISPNKPASAAPRSHDPFVTPPKPGTLASATPPAAAASLGLGGHAAKPGETKCLKHCGRFGTPARNGFCEPCYQRITAEGRKPLPKRWRCLFDGAMVKLRALHRFNLGKKPEQTNTSRCWTCQKKIGILGFQCRCRYTFCSTHRYMEQHECRYDIKSLHRKKLKKENEEIRAAKIENKL